MRTSRLGLLAATVVIAVTWELSLRSAQADYIVTLEQVGPNVVATGSGAFDLTGLSFVGTFASGAAMNPSTSILAVASGTVDDYVTISGPSSFGTGGATVASSSSGDAVAISGPTGEFFVPHGYISGQVLSDSSTYNNATFSSLGVTPGTYVWTWGPGADQKFTLEIKFPTPNNITQCKSNGWRMLSRANGTPFKNQGECIEYVNTGR